MLSITAAITIVLGLACAIFLCLQIIKFVEVYRLTKRLEAFEPISEEELTMLSYIDEKYYVDMLTYVRQMTMSVELQEYLAQRKDLLEAVSYYMLLQTLRADISRREEWEKNKSTGTPKTHVERMILKRLQSAQKNDES